MSTFASTSVLRHTAFQGGLARRVTVGLAATLVVALAAHASFPLPFTPVPFTMQPLAVLLVGLLLGPVDGFFVLLAYLAEGAAGLPVFSPTGLGGLLQLFGPTGGYLMADPIVALTAGLLVHGLVKRIGAYWAAALACSVATVLLFAAGATWLCVLHPMSVRALWVAAIGPFLPGELVKIFVAAGIFRALHPSPAR